MATITEIAPIMHNIALGQYVDKSINVYELDFKHAKCSYGNDTIKHRPSSDTIDSNTKKPDCFDISLSINDELSLLVAPAFHRQASLNPLLEVDQYVTWYNTHPLSSYR
jgi:hypothetical protein